MKWKEYSLDDLIHIKHGYAFKGEYFSEEPTDDILLTPGNFAIGGGFKAQKLKYYNGDFPVDYILDENEVIVTMTDLSKEADTLGFSAKVPAWYGKRFLHNQRIGLVKLKTDDFDQDYLYWLMRTFSYQRFVANGATGATVKHTSPTKICQYKFTAPVDKNTQRKIASILSAYDDLIENNLKRIKLLEEATEIAFKAEFDFFKPSNEINKLPNGWKVQRADVIFRINIGKTPPREQEEWFNDVDSGIKWVSIKDINNSTVYMLNTSENVTENAVNKFNMNVAKSDTVLLSFKLTVGKVAITTEEMVTNEAIAHFNIDDETRMNSEFIYFYLKNFPYDSLGSTSSIGTAINSKIVKAMPVLLPPKSVIQEFGQKIKPSFQMIKILLKQNTKLREARDILLPKLMSGQIEI